MFAAHCAAGDDDRSGNHRPCRPCTDRQTYPTGGFHIDALKKMGVTGIYTCEGTEDVKPADADKPQELPEPTEKI